MAEEFGLHELAVEDARNGHQRPKIEEYDDSLFAVLHTVELAADDGDDELLVGEVDIFVGRNYVLSVRTARSRASPTCARAPSASRSCCKHGAGFVLLRADGHRRRPLLPDPRRARDASSSRSRSRSSSRNAARSNIEALYELKRKLMTLKHAVEPLMEAIGKLYGGRVPQICTGMQEYFRDVYDHLQRINATIESIRDMLTTAIQVNLGMISLTESEVTKRLAAWAAHHRRADADRRHLRHELQAHAGARLAVWAIRCRSRSWSSIDI